ncbi:hypothetical protein P3X46_019972 [Hevea brasiliensis]|uniref:Uncharacterized protein n=1 Tax=Hevea brasiliensis TaxID=3981 RepID=A0ABQ9LKF6_HEVBR|nr:hypothetical protein P3X46_019972 [Hevea brasiliensis]
MRIVLKEVIFQAVRVAAIVPSHKVRILVARGKLECFQRNLLAIHLLIWVILLMDFSGKAKKLLLGGNLRSKGSWVLARS